MGAVAFDTLKLAQRLEAAGLPGRQAQEIASAIAETIGDAVVTREYLDLRLGEATARLEAKIAEIASRDPEVDVWSRRAADSGDLGGRSGAAAAHWPLSVTARHQARTPQARIATVGTA